MTYTSFVFFLVYFGITYLLYSIFPLKAKWCVLLFGSAAFYMAATKGHIEYIIISSVIIWAVGLVIQKLSDMFKEKKKGLSSEERKKLKQKYKNYKLAALSAGVILNLAFLLVLKYFNFFGETLNGIFNTNIPALNVIQPLGISFYTLQAISYITDVYRGRYRAEKNVFKVSLYLMFFLTVVEGPIARYDQFGTQLGKCKRFCAKDLSYGAQLIVWGLFKKIVIADRVSMLVATVFDDGVSQNGSIVVLAVLAYTLQLYCEFSGVMDVVTGFAQMMGLEMPKNFERPFFAKGINEFWQRWHMTLGGWLRDYIFYPISLSKPFMKLTKSARKKFNPYYANLIPTSVALFFVWFANGMWHGASWKYIVYGLYYYFLMMLGLFCEPLSAKVCEKLHINRKSKAFSAFQMLRTFAVVCGGMMIFRANTFSDIFSMAGSIFKNFNAGALISQGTELGLNIKDYVVVAVGIVFMLIVGIIQEKKIPIRENIGKLWFPIRLAIYLLAIYVIIVFGAYGENYGVVDLIYANF